MLALASQSDVTAVDRDPISLHLAAANVRTVLSAGGPSRARWQAADVQLIDLTEVAAWHIDPDRRPTGPRTTSLEWSSPSLDIIERMLVVNENAAIKLAPASRVPDAWSATCEREWISRGGECRQQVVWHGGLARSPGLRRATVLRTPASTSGEPRSPPRTIVGEANQSAPIAAAVQQYVFDVDAAVLAAHLKGALAAEHGLQLLAGGASYLTGASPIVVDEALTCFEVDDVLPLRVPAVARYLSAAASAGWRSRSAASTSIPSGCDANSSCAAIMRRRC